MQILYVRIKNNNTCQKELHSINRDTNVEKKHMDAKGERRGWDELGDWNWHI